MGERSDKIGAGTDWGEEGLRPTVDLNPTFDTVIDNIGTGHAQNAYMTLQANDVFANKDNLAADEYTDSNGTNNTLNAGATTAIYTASSDDYRLGFTDEASGDTTHQSNMTDAANAFDSNDSTFGFCSSTSTGEIGYLGKTFGSKYVGWLTYKVSCIDSSAPADSISVALETYNGTVWTGLTTLINISDGGETIASGNYYIDDTVQGIRFRWVNSGAGASRTGRLYTMEYGDFDASSLRDRDWETI